MLDIQSLRPSSLKERESFYKKEFSLKRIENWLHGRIKPQIFEIDVGTETKIARNKREIGKLFVFDLSKLSLTKQLTSLKGTCLEKLPEDIYYDRNIYKNVSLVVKKKKYRNAIGTRNWLGQELAFDLDPENISCSCKKRKLPEIFKFCENCLEGTKQKTLEMYEFLKSKLNFEKVEIVYSGRGYHLHVFDRPAFKLNLKERSAINNKLKKFPIDPWVSRGHIRLIRLPYTLNALVSRVVLPLTRKELEKFDPFSSEKAVPRFLK